MTLHMETTNANKNANNWRKIQWEKEERKEKDWKGKERKMESIQTHQNKRSGDSLCKQSPQFTNSANKPLSQDQKIERRKKKAWNEKELDRIAQHSAQQQMLSILFHINISNEREKKWPTI